MSSKAIYQPKGKAREYAAWACNFYNGCSGMCEYCYLKRPPLSSTMGQSTPELKKCFKDEKHALHIFEAELLMNLPDLKKYGIFLSFSTDPCLPETINLTYQAMFICNEYKVPVTILTKQTWWVEGFLVDIKDIVPDIKLAIGFTISNADHIEPGCAPHDSRVKALQQIHDAGFKTWISIEPMFDAISCLMTVADTIEFTDHYKIGQLSGANWASKDLIDLIFKVSKIADSNINASFYWKDGIIRQADITRDELPLECVGRDHNMFQTNSDSEDEILEFVEDLYDDENVITACPACGITYDDADSDFLICHHCGWNANENKYI